MDNLEDWLNTVENSVNLSASDKAEITGAGAKAFEKVLHDETPRSDENYSKGRTVGHSKGRKTKHLQDMITYQDGYTAEGQHTGDTDVGFDGKYYAFLAKIINNGKHKMSSKELANTHFVDRAQEKAKEAVFEAEQKKYKELMNHDSD